MPLEQVANSLTFYAFFTSSKQGVAGLTVTADVYRNGTAILTAQACTEVGGGIYSYTLSSANVNAEGEYIALFKTASAGVDQQHIPAIWCISKAGVEYLDAQVTSRAAAADYTTARAVKIDNLDAAITSRLGAGNVTVGSYAAGQDPATLVWGAGTRTLTAFGFNVTVGTNNDKSGYALAIAPPTVANIWDAATSGMSVVGSVGKRVADYVDAAVSSRLGAGAYVAPDNSSIGTILSRTDVATSTRASGADWTGARAAKIDRLDVTVSSVADAVSGPGGIVYEATVLNPANQTPLDGVGAWVTSDVNGAVFVAGTKYTDGQGKVSFMLDAGTYYLWLQLSGWEFPSPTIFVVS